MLAYVGSEKSNARFSYKMSGAITLMKWIGFLKNSVFAIKQKQIGFLKNHVFCILSSNICWQAANCKNVTTIERYFPITKYRFWFCFSAAVPHLSVYLLVPTYGMHTVLLPYSYGLYLFICFFVLVSRPQHLSGCHAKNTRLLLAWQHVWFSVIITIVFIKNNHQK